MMADQPRARGFQRSHDAGVVQAFANHAAAPHHVPDQECGERRQGDQCGAEQGGDRFPQAWTGLRLLVQDST